MRINHKTRECFLDSQKLLLLAISLWGFLQTERIAFPTLLYTLDCSQSPIFP